MLFQIPTELAPGAYRHEVGFFAPGETVSLPDAAGDLPDLRYVPLDAAAYARLVELYGADKVKAKHGDAFKAPAPAEEPKKVDETLTVSQAAEKHGKSGRAADK
jgi:hypothetical protein